MTFGPLHVCGTIVTMLRSELRTIPASSQIQEPVERERRKPEDCDKVIVVGMDAGCWMPERTLDVKNVD